jgi:hypothetical protein
MVCYTHRASSLRRSHRLMHHTTTTPFPRKRESILILLGQQMDFRLLGNNVDME